MGSYLDARRHNGEWLLRMEDLDPPREKPGAADDILRTLEAFGFEWGGTVLYQSTRTEAYRDAADGLFRQDLAYPCSCSRREVNEAGLPGIEGMVYPGTCRTGHHPNRRSKTLRIRTDATPISFSDRIHGPLSQRLEQEVGDFIMRRTDGLFAYQLAVVLDDAYQEINQVVRGADLLLSTPRQIHLQRLLDLPQPKYAHLPLVLDEQGRKLSKQNLAHPVNAGDPLPALLDALRFLGQRLPEQRPANLEEFWNWGVATWNPAEVP
jgi:glutamyl-Q tRNA(Asp) synthetase